MAASYLTVSWKLKERVSFLFGGVIHVRHGERGEGQRFSSSKARRVTASVAPGKVTRKRDYLSVKWLVIKKKQGGSMSVKRGQYPEAKIGSYEIPGQVCIRNTWKGILEKTGLFSSTNEAESRSPVLVEL